ncbi:LysM peptidoglycan-binding domain-containing protein [Promicromonospora sp. Populi]|uniref:LysM peptidoglycan-binding domain-containing protein n=1 Tax=Promicromonospora sp. Populi TaxID=3239420 RepID=UPI0034E2DCEB
MSSSALRHTSPSYGAKSRQQCPWTEDWDGASRPPHAWHDGASRPPGTRHDGAAHPPRTWHGLAGLLALGIVLVVAAGVLAARTWQVGAGLGSALFPVEDIVELAAVAVGTVLASWVGLHAFVALAWVLAGRSGLRWAAGERTVALHAPAVIRRLARVAAGAGLGLALTAPTAMAVPDWGAGAASSADPDSAVVLELGWQPTQGAAASRPRPAPDRTSLVNRGQGTGTGREPVVVVEPGDTLWAIAADRLAAEQATADPSDAEIAAAVPRWHEANRQTLGPDPDLIHPGMVLREP